MNDTNLRRKLSDASRACKTSNFDHLPKDFPMSEKSDRILFDGKIRTRKRIILLTNGCMVGTCTMCPFPSESATGIRAENLCNQFDNSFARDSVDDYEVVTIFCNGNFFNNREIPKEAREHMFGTIGRSKAKYVVVESLPQFVSEEMIVEAKSLLNDKIMSVFMGLQSSNDYVRNVLINTSCTRANYEKAVDLLFAVGYIPHAFLMFKPPFLTEREAIDDIMSSLDYLGRLGVKTITICPTRVAPDTVLEKLYGMDMYRVPWNWSIVHVLFTWNDRYGTTPMVNTSELKPEMNADSVCASGCTKCRQNVITEIEKALYSRNFDTLRGMPCGCQIDWHTHMDEEDEIMGNLSWEDRVNKFLNHESGRPTR